jgi:glycosyltransferase involved in cell wall biosynthesis
MNTFTIVTPSFNQGRFIENTIKSVLEQKGDFNIDYIIADGGSTDETVSIIQKYDEILKQKKYPLQCKGVNLTWWSRKDGGQGAAINEGFKDAKGDILAWINSDDAYEPGAFKSAVQGFESHPEVDFLYGDSKLINLSESLKLLPKRKSGGYKELRRENFILQPSVFFRRELWEKTGPIDTTLHLVFDYDLWLKMFALSKILYVPEFLSSYTYWDGCKTHKDRAAMGREWAILDKKYNLRHFSTSLFYNSNTLPVLDVFRIKFPRLYSGVRKIFVRLNSK